MDKPQKPTDLLPESFGGQKENFSEDKIATGYQPDVPDILGGANLNYMLDAAGKNFKYNNSISDFVNGLPVNKSITTDANNKLIYTEYGIKVYSSTETYAENEWVLGTVDNEKGIYQSLVSSNKNNPLTDTTKWQKVSLGGGGGLEVGDIGIAALGIDETKGLRRYLNGQIITANANTQGFINKLKSAAVLYPSLVCTEIEWQAIASTSVGGQCGKFVINYDTDDTTAVSVRLPKIIMPIQGLTDLTKLGELVEAGLPTHAHSATSSSDRTGDHTHWMNGDIPTMTTIGSGWHADIGGSDGPFKQYTNTTAFSGGHSHVITTAIGDSTDENSIYGNSTTVQQEQPQFPYFIQIATGQETEVNITNEIELNNPFTLFDSKYSPNPLYNASWLKSNGTYYEKSVYVTAYEALMAENNTEISTGDSVTLPSGTTYVKKGLSVKLSTDDDITDYDFVINTSDETFRLPLLNGSEHLPSGKITQSGLTGDATPEEHTANKNGWFYIIQSSTSTNNEHIVLYEKSNGRGATSFNNVGWSNRVALFVKRGDTGVFAYNTQSPSVTRNYYFEEAQGNGTLYFYVGETVQNANLINAGRIEEKLDALTRPITNCILEAPNGVAVASGATITLKKGLKVLIPNGRNADGTLKNMEYTLPADTSEYIIPGSALYQVYFVIAETSSTGEVNKDSGFTCFRNEYFEQDTPPLAPIEYTLWYDTSSNFFKRYINGVWNIIKIAKVAQYSYINNAITSLIPYSPVEFLKYTDIERITKMAFPSSQITNLTLAPSETLYTAPADGWVCADIVAYGTGFIGLYSHTPSYAVIRDGANIKGSSNVDTDSYAGFIPVRKGDTFYVFYNGVTITQTLMLQFIYAQGGV